MKTFIQDEDQVEIMKDSVIVKLFRFMKGLGKEYITQMSFDRSKFKVIEEIKNNYANGFTRNAKND